MFIFFKCKLTRLRVQFYKCEICCFLWEIDQAYDPIPLFCVCVYILNNKPVNNYTKAHLMGFIIKNELTCKDGLFQYSVSCANVSDQVLRKGRKLEYIVKVKGRVTCHSLYWT